MTSTLRKTQVTEITPNYEIERDIALGKLFFECYKPARKKDPSKRVRKELAGFIQKVLLSGFNDRPVRRFVNDSTLSEAGKMLKCFQKFCFRGLAEGKHYNDCGYTRIGQAVKPICDYIWTSSDNHNYDAAGDLCLAGDQNYADNRADDDEINRLYSILLDPYFFAADKFCSPESRKRIKRFLRQTAESLHQDCHQLSDNEYQALRKFFFDLDTADEPDD